jgi:hypothetical protein
MDDAGRLRLRLRLRPCPRLLDVLELGLRDGQVTVR